MVSSALSVFATVIEWNTKRMSRKMREDWKKDFARVTIKVEKNDAAKMQNEGYLHRTKILKKTLEKKLEDESPCKVEILNMEYNDQLNHTNIHMYITFKTDKTKSNSQQEVELKMKETIDAQWNLNNASARESGWDLKVEWDSKKSPGDIELNELEGTTTAGGDVNAAGNKNGGTTEGGGIPAANMIPSQRTMSYHRSNSFSEEDNDEDMNETMRSQVSKV